MQIRTIPAASAVLLPLALLAGCAQPPPAPAPVADIILVNGGIYTADPARPWAEAAAIRSGRLLKVGDNAGIEALRGPATRVIDLAGRMALPGFHDAHAHPVSAGQAMLGCNLWLITSVNATLDKIRACAAASKSQWLIVHDFNLGLFPDGSPHKSLLDEAAPGRAVYVSGVDDHSAWVSSRALELAGITAATADPPGGAIVRDPATGEPSGTLRESAMELVERVLPEPTHEEVVVALAEAVRMMNSFGVTSFIDADVGEKTWRAYQELDRDGQLTARVVTSLTYGAFSEHPGAAFDPVLARRAVYASGRVNTGAVKIYVDGVLETETAALLQPYVGKGTDTGMLNLEVAELNAAVARFDALGLQVHMHAIGDRGVRVALDSVEQAQMRNGRRDNRHHIAHLQLIDPADMPRFAHLGVAANFQAQWAYPDEYILDINLPDVGPERVQRMYPIDSMRRAGARIVGGSDMPVSSPNPLDAIETAMTRQDSIGRVQGALNPAEAVDLATMLAAYTREGAWLMHHDAEVGTIATGKRADIVVLDRDLFRTPAADISEAKVMLTLLDGAPVYQAPEN